MSTQKLFFTHEVKQIYGVQKKYAYFLGFAESKIHLQFYIATYFSLQMLFHNYLILVQYTNMAKLRSESVNAKGISYL